MDFSIAAYRWKYWQPFSCHFYRNFKWKANLFYGRGHPVLQNTTGVTRWLKLRRCLTLFQYEHLSSSTSLWIIRCIEILNADFYDEFLNICCIDQSNRNHKLFHILRVICLSHLSHLAGPNSQSGSENHIMLQSFFMCSVIKFQSFA